MGLRRTKQFLTLHYRSAHRRCGRRRASEIPRPWPRRRLAPDNRCPRVPGPLSCPGLGWRGWPVCLTQVDCAPGSPVRATGEGQAAGVVVAWSAHTVLHVCELFPRYQRRPEEHRPHHADRHRLDACGLRAQPGCGWGNGRPSRLLETLAWSMPDVIRCAQAAEQVDAWIGRADWVVVQLCELRGAGASRPSAAADPGRCGRGVGCALAGVRLAVCPGRPTRHCP